MRFKVRRKGHPVNGAVSERRVAELAAEGLSNAQIAERLIVGSETVKSHLSSVFRKLGIANRVELAVLVAARR